MSYTSRKPARTYSESLDNRIVGLEERVKIINAAYTGFPLLDLIGNPPPAPNNGDCCLDWSRGGRPYYYYNLKWRPFQGYPTFEMKVFKDNKTNLIGDGAFIFAIPFLITGMKLVDAHIYNTTVGTGVTTVQVRNIDNANVDMLSTRSTIDSGEKTSYTAAAPPVVNVANSTVTVGQELAIDVDTVGSGSKGLGAILTFE